MGRAGRGARGMKHLPVHVLSSLLLLTLILEPGHAASGPSPFVPGEVLVRFRSEVSPGMIPALVAGHRTQIEEIAPRFHLWRLRVEPGSEQAMVRAWSALSQVLYAEPNYWAWAMADPPDDTYYHLQWNLDRVRAPAAWEITQGDPSMPIAIIDTGIDLSHPDLVDKLWINPGETPGNGVDDDGNGYVDDLHGYDFINADGDPVDDYGHGTHVAGIAAATTHNGLGVASMAPANPLMALKVLGSDGEGDYAGIIQAIDYALGEGAKVMNLSLAGTEHSPALQDAVQAATAAGAILVAAAGNDQTGTNPLFYPAAYTEVLAIGATDSNDRIAPFSAHHPYVDVVAPGLSVYSTHWRQSSGSTYAYMLGTSMAAPHAAGLAALLLAADPSLTVEGIEERIVGSAEDLGAPGWDAYYGWGRIDAHSALCTATLDPATLAFLADGHSLSAPGMGGAQITNSGAIDITWTTTISPSSAGWIIVTPASGTLAPGESQALQIRVDPADLEEAYGDYACRVQVASICGTGEGAVDIQLHYVPRLHQLWLLSIDKS